ncbi:MAG TPA: halocarboxylic acid dehydrogenase DehI family protein [Terriglobales bacterium]|jgi:hypothetical protein|nr:halocarboxylic acid dehydrogenase DehI family protein [Terriglobales bacterium]
MPWKKGQRPKFVREQDATGQVADTYSEIRRQLGLPFVPLAYQIYATYPRFLELHWQAMRPVVETEAFFRLAERVRADGYTRAHSYLRVPDLCERVEDLRFSTGARHELTATVELLHYKDALLLLLLAAQLQAFDHPVGTEAPATPAGVPELGEAPVLVDEERAAGPVRRVFDDLKRTLDVPFVLPDYRALARWPDFLTAYWQVMKPVVQSPLYSECQWALRDTTWEMTRELPARIELSCEQLTDAGMSDDDVATCVKITELFVKHLSGMVLNIAAAKIGLEGGTVAAPALVRGEEMPSRAA